MSNLADALMATRDALEAGESPTTMDEIAVSYEVNPLLLRRKFIESYGDPAHVRERYLRARKAREDEAEARRLALKAMHERTRAGLTYSW